MNNNILISDKDLESFGRIDNLSNKAAALLAHQKDNWKLVESNFRNLEQIKINKFDFEGYYIKVQFNPSRIISTSAKVDQKSIEERACFLCKENIPSMQRGIKYKNDYVILINPFPIFKQHLTIPHLQHIPQSIQNSFEDLLDLSYDLRDNFFVFYNGPKCGASAPDHLHFQAGLKYSTPIENEYKNLIDKFGRQLYNFDATKAFAVDSQLIKFFFFEAEEKRELVKVFTKFFNQIENANKSSEEPLINILSTFDENNWKVFLFLREKHRPRQYFAENNSQILISPAAVDIAGLCITPREEDFNKIIKEDLEDIFKQVLINEEKQNHIIDNLEV